jgi:Tol biopolymer transport system component
VKTLTALAAVLFAAASLLITAGLASATPPGENGRIAYRLFLNNEQTHAAILTMRPNGSERRWVTHPAPGVAHVVPDWSADGHWIAYIRVHMDFWDTGEPRKRPRIFRIHPNGTGRRDLSTNCTGRCRHDDDPAWSPNGKWIAFSRVFQNPDEVDLMVMRADGTHVRHVTRHPLGRTEDWAVQWAPDGKRLVFSRYKKEPRGTEAVFTVRLDGTGLRRVTPWRVDFGPKFPDWSPNGRWILFRDHGIWLTHPNGEDRHRITDPDGEWISSSFSPDGTKIVTSRAPGVAGKADVFVMNLDGSGLLNITQSRRWDSGPDWGPRAR